MRWESIDRNLDQLSEIGAPSYTRIVDIVGRRGDIEDRDCKFISTKSVSSAERRRLKNHRQNTGRDFHAGGYEARPSILPSVPLELPSSRRLYGLSPPHAVTTEHPARFQSGTVGSRGARINHDEPQRCAGDDSYGNLKVLCRLLKMVPVLALLLW